MKSVLIWCVTLTTTFISCTDPDNSLCKQRTSSIEGIPLPSLPNQFHAIFEANILQKGYTVYQEEIYDYLGNRGVIITTRHGRSTKTITDFASYSVHQIDLATGTCRVEDLRQMKLTLFNFTTTATGGHVKGLADIFKFSAKFDEEYLGTTQVRGIPAHHWTTCLHVEALKATFNMDYYFSMKTHDIAASQKVPLRTSISGIAIFEPLKSSLHIDQSNFSSDLIIVASNVDKNNVLLNGTHNFNHVYDFILFRPGPVKDNSVFQVPPGIICTGSKVKRPMPKIADQVSFGIEKVIQAPLKTSVVYMQVDYDFTSKLVRLDLSQVPTSDLRKMLGNSSITLIQDFHIGVQYVIDSTNGNCSVTEITASFDDFTPRPSYLLPPEMRHPIALLDVDYTNMAYQGEKQYRGLPVKSWGKIDNVTNFIHEIYFTQTTNLRRGPFQITEESRLIPVGIYTSISDITKGDMTKVKSKAESYTNIYNYQPNRIDPSRFDIQSCYNRESEYKQLHVELQTASSSSVLSERSLYLNHIHQFISKTAKVQLTRISDLSISEDKGRNSISVVFTLLDKLPMPPGRQSNTDGSPSLQEAYNNLELAVQAGTSITVQNQILRLVTRSLKPSSSMQIDVKTSTDLGYSSGSMAGLGLGMLATGTICGLASAYMFYRRKQSSIPYELQCNS